jgi:tetratricopeptide (TPR) repeat protein
VTKSVVVLDTNVLLADPTAVLSFPRHDVVIPETVLGELDKLKTARVDPDLRFRGREVSRILFDLSEEGSLVEGVALPDGGTLRVAPFEPDAPVPAGVQTRNADDRILAAAFQMRQLYGDDAEITLVTNDLNMLLKAQTLGVTVQRHEGGVEASFARRYVIRPFQRYKVPLGILAIAFAVFAAVVWVAAVMQPKNAALAGNVPAELQNVLTPSQKSAFNALTALNNLQLHNQDPESLRSLSTFYYDQYAQLTASDPTVAYNAAEQAIRYSERYLAVAPMDVNVRVDMAVLNFYTGQSDKAIQLVNDALKIDRSHIKANYNLGIFLWQSSRRDYVGAAAQFEKVLSLTKNDTHNTGVYQSAARSLEAVRSDAKAAGVTIPSTESSGSADIRSQNSTSGVGAQ